MAAGKLSLTALRGPVATYQADGVANVVLHNSLWTLIQKPTGSLRVMIFNQSTTKSLWAAVPGPTGNCVGASTETGVCTDQRGSMIPPRGFRTFDLEVPSDDECSSSPESVDYIGLWGGSGEAHPFDLTFGWQTSGTKRGDQLIKRQGGTLERMASALVDVLGRLRSRNDR